MDRTKLNELLDSIYELEGLVHLALTRDDNPDRLPLLIKMKGEKLSELASTFDVDVIEADKDESLEESVDKDESLEESVDKDESPEEPADMEETPIEEDMQSVVESVFDRLPLDDTGEREPRGRLVFSINDRYRFKRELFNNSDVDFNNTLAIVASMENYDEAEDYFLGEMQWDAKRVDVADFLDIIKRYFKE